MLPAETTLYAIMESQSMVIPVFRGQKPTGFSRPKTNRKAVVSLSPTLPLRLRWVYDGEIISQPQRGCAFVDAPTRLNANLSGHNPRWGWNRWMDNQSHPRVAATLG
jgi:hypothetical protein